MNATKQLVTAETETVQYGCECICANHRNGAASAPLFLLIERKGALLRVCSRCDLSSDKKVARLFTERMPMQPYMDFDPIGAICTSRYLDLPTESEFLAAKAVGV